MAHIHINEAFELYFATVGLPFPPPFIYHYTSAESCREILREGALQATRVNFLDDVLEYAVARTVYNDALDKVLSESSSMEPRSQRARIMVVNRVRGIPDWRYFRGAPPCVVSFSADGNMLSQWRAYADDCRGYAIGIAPDSLAPATGSYLGDRFVAPCLYNGEDQRTLLVKILRRLLEEQFEYAMHHEAVDPQIMDDEGEDIAIILAHFACLFKDSSYVEEREWRLVIPNWSSKPRVDGFRCSQGVLRPYLNAQLDEETYLDLRIGPRAPDVALESSRLLCQASKRIDSNSSVARSDIQLRY